MSSVSGSDGSYNYYQKQFSEQADENTAERKKAKEREDERVSSLERRNARELRAQEESSDHALNRAKEASNEALRNSQESAKQDAERFRHDTYDRFGRLNQDQSSEYRTQLEELQNNLETQKRRHDEELHRAEEAYSTHLGERERQADLATQRAIEQTRDDLGAIHENSANEQHDQSTRAAKEAGQRYQNLDKTRLEEISQQRQRYQGALDESSRDYNRRLELERAAYDKSTSRQEQNLRDSQSHNADRLRLAHEAETRDLRSQMSAMVEAEKDYMKQGAQGKSDVVAEYDDQWRTKLESQQNSHQREVDTLHAQIDQTESYLARQNDHNLRERDAFLARTIEKQNQDHHNQQRQLEDSFQHDHTQMELSAKRDHLMQEKILEQRMGEASENSAKALENQSTLLSASAREQHQNDQYQVQKLQTALREHETSADTSLVSPAAESALRRQIADQYQKVSDSDQDRRLRENDQIRTEYKDKLRTETDSNLVKESKLNRKIAADQNDDRNRFNSHVADLEFMKDSALRQKDDESTRSQENLTKNYSRTLERQNRQNDDSMNVAKTESNARLSALREEYDFKQRMAQRDFSTKVSDTIREYGKRLQDQKSEYEAHIDDLKSQNTNQARDAERKLKTMLENQQRNYEQKLAQTEAQHQERERYITQNFQDELEKVRKANAMLIQKRS